MANCSKCGSPNRDGVKFCSACGGEMSSSVPSYVPPPPPPERYRTPLGAPGFFTILMAADTPRPFLGVLPIVGVAFAAVNWTMLGMSLLAGSSVAMAMGSGMAGLFSRSDSSGNPVLMLLIGAVLIASGLCGAAGAIGMWVGESWGNPLSGYLQSVGILVGLYLLVQSGSEGARGAGAGGAVAMMGVIAIAYAVGLMVLIFRKPEAR